MLAGLDVPLQRMNHDLRLIEDNLESRQSIEQLKIELTVISI